MISFIIAAVKIIALLGFLVFIHEFGHFTVAKLCKVKVNEFAIGFGPVLFSKQGKETKYQLRLIPLGGFVSMEGEDERSDAEGSFSKVKIPKRIAIVAAGGLVNIIFAIVIYFGLQVVSPDNISTKVSELMPEYAAEQVGILPGDEIIKINGHRVRRQLDVNKYVSSSNGEEVNVLVKRGNENIEFKVAPTKIKYKATGLYLKSQNDTTIEGFDQTAKNDESEGFKIGDRVVSVNGINVKDNAEELTSAIQNQSEGEPIRFDVERKNELITVTITPETEERYLLGVGFEKAENSLGANIYYGFFNTGDFAFSIVDNLKMLITGKVRTNDLMGPVGISSVVAKTNGFKEFIYIMALISLSLGVTNLLPFPPLDGGKVVILIIEAIRGKPLQEKHEMAIQMLGFSLIILLSLYVTYNDILRL